MINVTQGIEGDDLIWHLKLLGVNDLPKNVYFIPLVNHYNLHNGQWFDNVRKEANSYNTVVFYDLVHTGDYEQTVFKKVISEFEHSNKVYLTVNQNKSFEIDSVKIIRWDFMWNRYKAYYTESVPENLQLHHFIRGNYHKIDIDYQQTRTKKFMSPMGRDYGLRTRLYDIVNNYDGYISNRSKGITFENEPVMGIFTPIPDKFYNDSYFSVYAESNSSNNELIHLTEKTFEPLTKGHFILPLSNTGSIIRIKELGFKLPDFIDYSYDLESNIDLKFDMLIAEFKRLLTLDLTTLYSQNKEILEHNRNCLSTIPYDNRILEIFNV